MEDICNKIGLRATSQLFSTNLFLKNLLDFAGHKTKKKYYLKISDLDGVGIDKGGLGTKDLML